MQALKDGMKMSDWAQGTYRAPFYRLTLDREADIPVQARIIDESHAAAPIIRNNIFRNHRARGVHCKLSNAVISNNLFEHCVNTGITYGTDLHFANSCNASEVLIENNTFRHMQHSGDAPWSSKCGIITFYNGSGKHFNAAGSFRNITIRNNTFEDDRSIPFLITSTDGLTITGNKIIRSHAVPRQHGKPIELNQGAVAYLNRVTNATISDNVLISPGPQLDRDNMVQAIEVSGDYENGFAVSE